ncbi:hypothetical protein S40288_11054 [Stachybotrys chartarum IBT 40288]|nr:hypothetical protein S40288_11054 [Stachybotrys chartarum IBT 40288]
MADPAASQSCLPPNFSLTASVSPRRTASPPSSVRMISAVHIDSSEHIDPASAPTASSTPRQPAASKALLGDFTKLCLLSVQHTLSSTSSPVHSFGDAAVSPAPGKLPLSSTHSERSADPATDRTSHLTPVQAPVKLGNFSKLFSQLSSSPSTPVHSSDSKSTNGTMATVMSSGPATHIAIGNTQLSQCPSEGYSDIKLMADFITDFLSQRDTQRMSSGSDSEHDVQTPYTTPPSSLEAEKTAPIHTLARKKSSTKKSEKAQKQKQKQVEVVANGDLHSPTLVPLFFVQSGNIYQQQPVWGLPRSAEEKHKSLSMGLVKLRAEDAAIGISQPQVSANGVHVFLDMSNIQISFIKTLKALHGLQENDRLSPAPRMELKFLNELLLRGRTAKVLNVGCSVSPRHQGQPAFVEELRQLGYHVDLRERKLVETSYSGYSSDPASAWQTPQKKRYKEDLVDETLQIRIGESVMEYFEERGTIVLVTGDAKPAEFSDGFFAYANRALKMGWHVEVVSWKSSLSSAWTNPGWTEQWADRFRVIELDDFLDDLTA